MQTIFSIINVLFSLATLLLPCVSFMPPYHGGTPDSVIYTGEGVSVTWIYGQNVASFPVFYPGAKPAPYLTDLFSINQRQSKTRPVITPARRSDGATPKYIAAMLTYRKGLGADHIRFPGGVGGGGWGVCFSFSANYFLFHFQNETWICFPIVCFLIYCFFIFNPPPFS